VPESTRRDFLAAGSTLGVLTAGLLGAATASAKARTPQIDFNDPQQRLKAKVKMLGSLANEPVHTFVRLHLYGYSHEGNVVPFFSMNNYAVNVWNRLASGNYAVKVYESGVYTKFDEQTVLTEWDNPFTGERRAVHQFRSGPLNIEFGPDGIIAGAETTVKPRAMSIEVLEDTVIHATQSSFRFPSPFQPEEFPKESAGKLFYWDSQYSHMSPLAAVADRRVVSAPAQITLTNLVSWSPWLGMAQKPGRTFGRGVGRKISGPHVLPAAVLEGMRQHTPQVLDIDNWGPSYDDVLDYKSIIRSKK
jgi:hypothetical protein